MTAVKKLQTKAGRKDSATFIVEGPQALREAFAHRADIRQVFVTTGAMERWGEIMQAARAADVEITIVSEGVLEAMAETKSPQGWLATCGMEIPTLEDRLRTRFERVQRIQAR